MKLHSDSEILTPADATRLFQDRETERLLYTIIVHLCILDLVILRTHTDWESCPLNHFFKRLLEEVV